MSLIHLHPTTDTAFPGDAVADARMRLDHDAFRAAIRATAQRLADRGIGPGDVVAVVLPNRVELVVTMYAARPRRHPRPSADRKPTTLRC